MTRKFAVVAALMVLSLLLGACGAILGGGEDLEATRVALAVMQTQIAQDQAQAAQPEPEEPQPEPPQPEEPQPEPPQPEEPQPEEPQPEETETEAPEPEALFLVVVSRTERISLQPGRRPDRADHYR